MTKAKFWTVGQIDATGVRGPHEKELEDIGFSEDWTISIEMFPEVNIHMAYTYLGDEFGDGIEAEFKFFLSGERACWVPGEDSATFIDIVMDFMERKIKRIEPFENHYEKKTELMEKVLKQRSEPFTFLKDNDIKKLATFLSAKVWKVDNGWQIRKEFFPKIFIDIIWSEQNDLDIKFSGDNLSKNIESYHIEFIGIFFLNHILRFITVNNINKDLPDICYKMFSRYYTKNIGNWDHRTR